MGELFDKSLDLGEDIVRKEYCIFKKRCKSKSCCYYCKKRNLCYYDICSISKYPDALRCKFRVSLIRLFTLRIDDSRGDT